MHKVPMNYECNYFKDKREICNEYTCRYIFFAKLEIKESLFCSTEPFVVFFLQMSIMYKCLSFNAVHLAYSERRLDLHHVKAMNTYRLFTLLVFGVRDVPWEKMTSWSSFGYSEKPIIKKFYTMYNKCGFLLFANRHENLKLYCSCFTIKCANQYPITKVCFTASGDSYH